MFPFRYRKLFQSRWAAILWSIGICITAVQVAGFGDAGGDHGNVAANAQAPDNATDADLSKLEAQVHRFEDAR